MRKDAEILWRNHLDGASDATAPSIPYPGSADVNLRANAPYPLSLSFASPSQLIPLGTSSRAFSTKTRLQRHAVSMPPAQDSSFGRKILTLHWEIRAYLHRRKRFQRALACRVQDPRCGVGFQLSRKLLSRCPIILPNPSTHSVSFIPTLPLTPSHSSKILPAECPRKR